jgi:hypothetical protein
MRSVVICSSDSCASTIWKVAKSYCISVFKGVVPATEFIKDSGIEMSDRGFISVDKVSIRSFHFQVHVLSVRFSPHHVFSANKNLEQFTDLCKSNFHYFKVIVRNEY